MKYRIQQQIETLAENAVGMMNEQPSFEANGITFTHWDFNHRDGWFVDAWQAEANIEASDYKKAFAEFGKLLTPVIPRIAFVSQCYTEARMQPILIVKHGSDIGLFSDFFASDPVGLMFMDEEKSALDKLLADNSIDNAFFFYWNDAVNTAGHTAKLLVLFSAIEALAKKPNSEKDWVLIENILGKELKDEVFKPTTGLRHRLIHGDYFSPKDSKNYVDVIHKKVMVYFNDHILGAKLLGEDVTHPQRHFFGNKMHGARFISPKDSSISFNLRTALDDANSSEDRRLDKFDWVTDDKLTSAY
ncbi:MAG TPA: hypothetical protein VFP32_01200 [Candidatus Saccharimonadales bacterium]|nr:hypothetical protein [Candidatus Saccharimonadales bacterium]